MTIKKCFLTGLLCVAFLGVLSSTVSAKDEWLQVRSKNFYLIGNAPEKDIRRVATKLEQFRETFRQVFRSMRVDSPIPTNVVVFKSDSSFKPFKPRRGDGKADNLIAGYFQPGEDVNYVTLSTEGTEAETYGTIFHEYVHSIIETNFGKLDVPSWFNEGLAEYYSTFQIEEDQKVKLGYPDGNHLALLADTRLIPLSELFANSPRNYGGGHGRSIFYAQSWALIHYLVQTGKSESLDKFILATVANKPAEQAFRESFGVGYTEMEKELKRYIGQRSFKYHALTFKNKLSFETEMNSTPLTEADSNTYLGDLLYHTHRPDDAEPFLRTALTLDPNSSFANTTLGMVKVRQRKYDEAKQFLDKATKDTKNHVALFRYAELLLREGQDEFGHMDRLEPATAARMRDLLKKAIALKPSFTESYELLAFVSVITNEHLDEAIAGLNTALKYRPGNMRYGMRAAEIYLRQNKFKEALSLADKIAKHADEEVVRANAARLADSIREREQIIAQHESDRKKYEEAAKARNTASEAPRLGRRDSDTSPSLDNARIQGMNNSLRTLEPGEMRVLGEITNIACKAGIVAYTVKTTDGIVVNLTSKDFQGLTVITFSEDGGAEIGCGTNLSGQKTVLSFRPDPKPKSGITGELVAIEFVPGNFRFMEPRRESPPSSTVVGETVSGSPPPPAATKGTGGGMGVSMPSREEIEQERRKFMLQSIADSIRKPTTGEKRIMGFIEKSECTNKGVFYTVKVGDQLFKLSDIEPERTFMRAYTRDVENLQIGCGMKNVDVPVVIVYTESTDKKPKVAGDVVSLEFVPKSFQLEP